jgi:hypothetical protein
MNGKKTERASIAEAASKRVAEWSDSKKAAFEQRTGLTLEKSQEDRNRATIKRAKKNQEHFSDDS